jgi:F-type H+-transporting ATPase subunit b
MSALTGNREKWRIPWSTLILNGILCLLPVVTWASGGSEAVEIESPFTLLMRAINFFLLAAILFYLLRKPLSNFLHQRQQGIRESLEQAKRAKEEAEARYRQMEKKLAEAQKEMAELKQMLIDQGRTEKEKILVNAQKEAERIRRQAELTAEQELKKAKQLLREEAVMLAAQMAEELLKQRIEPKDHTSLIQDYVKRLGKAAS